MSVRNLIPTTDATPSTARASRRAVDTRAEDRPQRERQAQRPIFGQGHPAIDGG